MIQASLDLGAIEQAEPNRLHELYDAIYSVYYHSDRGDVLAKMADETITLSMRVGAKIHVDFYHGIPIRIWSSKTRKDYRQVIFDFETLKLGTECFGMAKHHYAMNQLAVSINENGLGEAIRECCGVNCCICGCPLKDPVSKARGIGPECIKMFPQFTSIMSKLAGLAD